MVHVIEAHDNSGIRTWQRDERESDAGSKARHAKEIGRLNSLRCL
jgi:hypothetical protein